ncbi:hypothetical protein HUJ04_005477 [Dendroctonus ponderosae]|nr:hypothetical protein HUJ04_005477 [Dendroctonus ponderosae]
MFDIFSGQGGTSNAESPKDDISNADTETKDSQKLPFCEIHKTPDEKPIKEKVRWSYSPEEGPKCTTEPFISKKKEKKAVTPVFYTIYLNFLITKMLISYTNYVT